MKSRKTPWSTLVGRVACAAIYQLGQFGTAAKRLKQVDLQP